jgi:hypothetical protein
MTKAIGTSSKYVIFISFLQKGWLRGRISILRVCVHFLPRYHSFNLCGNGNALFDDTVNIQHYLALVVENLLWSFGGIVPVTARGISYTLVCGRLNTVNLHYNTARDVQRAYV